MSAKYPQRLTDLVCALLDNGWHFMVSHGKDTGNSPYVSVEARRGDDKLMVTWHTRATGTYRLFTCVVNRRDVSLTAALEVITR